MFPRHCEECSTCYKPAADVCSCKDCETKQHVRHDPVAGRWIIWQFGLYEHGANLAYLEGKSFHLPLHMTLKLNGLLRGNYPQRVLALMREAFRSDQ